MAWYANRQSGPAQTRASVGSTPTRATVDGSVAQWQSGSLLRSGSWVRSPPFPLSGLVAQLAEYPALTRDVVGATPTEVTVHCSIWACRLTGRWLVCTQPMRVRLPSRPLFVHGQVVEQ